MTLTLPPGMEINAPILPGFETILTAPALALRRQAAPRLRAAPRGAARRARRTRKAPRRRRAARLPARDARDPRRRLDGARPCPADLQDRRVEITGPVDRKMVINALNSGANVFMADFEDANTPTWDNKIAGPDQPARRDPAPHRSRSSPDGKGYALNDKTATLLVRPRGWHLRREARADRRRAASPAASSTSRSTSSTTRRSCSRAAAGRTSTCRRSRATSRRGCGTTSSSWRRTSSACRRARSRPRC